MVQGGDIGAGPFNRHIIIAVQISISVCARPCQPLLVGKVSIVDDNLFLPLPFATILVAEDPRSALLGAIYTMTLTSRWRIVVIGDDLICHLKSVDRKIIR